MDETYSASIHKVLPKRTDGDGMEKEEKANEPANLKVEQTMISEYRQSLSDKFIYRPVELNKCLVSPTPITGKVFNLIPKNKIERTKPSLNFSKEPKFVPYEPYKAAVKPIIPIKNEKCRRKNIIVAKNVDASNVQYDTNDVKKNDSTSISTRSDDVSKNREKVDIVWKIEKKMLEEKISQLKIENSELDGQVKFQAQVNTELKKLLVAAVGEDVETRVQLLTEDKLHLTKQLLKTVKSLSTHQEQIEWLAGQCEVWRSKFLASSKLLLDSAC